MASKPRLVQSADVFAAAVSEDIDPTDPDAKIALIAELNKTAFAWVGEQWRGATRTPMALRNFVSEWIITNVPEEIDQFQPAHDCAACRAGNDQAAAFLKEHPDRWIALANLHYTEVWRA